MKSLRSVYGERDSEKVKFPLLFGCTTIFRRLLQTVRDFIRGWPSSWEQVTALRDQFPHLVVHSSRDRLFVFWPCRKLAT